MKYNRFRTAALLLAALTVLTAASACGDSADTTITDGTATETAAVSETVDPNDRSQMKDNVPEVD